MILAVYGSPRRGGNTDLLMDSFLQAASEQTEVVEYRLRELELNPCLGCDKCSKTGICILDDDIWEIYERMEDASGLVISAPIYFASLPAQVKAFVDRAQPFWARKYKLSNQTLPGGSCFFISVCAVKTKKYFENAMQILHTLQQMLDMKDGGHLFYSGYDARGEILEEPEALERAEQLGGRFGLTLEEGDGKA